MLHERNLKQDVLALLLLALALFLGVSLVTYHPADPPSRLVYPADRPIENACGRSGALVAHHAFQTLGLGAYYLLTSFAVLVILLLTRRSIDQQFLRTVGWLLSLAGLTTLLALALPHASPGPVVGAGGYLGATGRGLLETHFASAGTYILTLSLVCAGLLLCTDYAIPSVAIRATRLVFHVMSWTTAGLRRTADTDAEEEIEEEEAEGEDEWEEEEFEDEDEAYDEVEDEEADEEQPASTGVRIRRRSRSKQDEEVSEDNEEEVTPSEETAAPSVKKRLTSALRIKKRTKSERDAVIEELNAASSGDERSNYELPSIDLLLEGEESCIEDHEKEVRKKAKLLEKTFASFGLKVKVVEIETGPVIAQYEVELEAGLRLSKITSLADDLAIGLRVPSVRIVAPIPGKNTVGVEVPNEHRQLVRLREVIEESSKQSRRKKIPIYLGKDVSGNPMVVDLASLPHLLIAGRTGTGKSVCLNSIIASMLMTRRPDEVRMLMIDPKMVELSPYKTLPHLMHPVVTDMRKAEAILAWAVEKMEERYATLARAGVRHVTVYNELGDDELRDRMQPETEDEWEKTPKQMPFIVIIADEIADLMMTSGKEVEQHIIRLAQKSRAVGIHLILATQKPTVDVITGLIKSNLPARIAFQVASRTDSRVVLDEMGADKLLGNGDMLFLLPGTSTLLRGQGTYLSDDEITRLIDCVGTSEPQFVRELIQLKVTDEKGEGPGKLSNRDDLYESAVDVVIREGRGSVSLLQRTLGIGYGRAARLVDYMAEDGIVGTYNGSQAREVLMSIEDWQAMCGEEPDEPLPQPRRTNRILPETDASAEPPRPEPGRHAPWEEEATTEVTLAGHHSPVKAISHVSDGVAETAPPQDGDSRVADDVAEEDALAEDDALEEEDTYEYEYDEEEEEEEEEEIEADGEAEDGSYDEEDEDADEEVEEEDEEEVEDDEDAEYDDEVEEGAEDEVEEVDEDEPYEDDEYEYEYEYEY
ncbi:MAG: DNA translocase FtsK [Pirellulales bacterium]